MRQINIDFSQTNPANGNKILGYRGEHKATQLIITPPEVMTQNADICSYRVVFGFECDNPYSSTDWYRSIGGDEVVLEIPSAVTSHSVVSLQLEGYGESGDLLIKSSTLYGFVFESSVYGDEPNWEVRPSIDTSSDVIQSGVAILAVDSNGNATEIAIYGDLPGGIDFIDSNKIKKITMIGSTKIADNQFKGCSSLRTVIIPDSVVSIGNNAFQCCRNLTNITLPNNLTFIGDYAFYYCSKLSNIAIPASVEYIGEYAFAYCNGLTEFIFPEKVTAVNKGVLFYCENLSTVHISNSTIVISEGAFSLCRNLMNINSETNTSTFFIPDSVKSIEKQAFNNCETVKKISMTDSVIYIGTSAFSGCLSLSEIVLSDSITEIAESLFAGCNNLIKINLPNGITKICSHAFNSCYSLTEITIPIGVNEIKDGAFRSCSNLTSADLRCNITEISKSVFSGCTQLTSIKITDKITRIDDGAFSSCSCLEIIDNLINVTYIGKDAFSYSGITTIELLSAQEIAYYAFRECRMLKTIIFGENVDVSIGEEAFCNCLSLTNIINSTSIIRIAGEAFLNCSSLTLIELGDRITNIGWGAFGLCSSLGCMYINNPVPPNAGTNAVPYDYDSFIGVYVPASDDDSVINTYSTATFWKQIYSAEKLFEQDDSYITDSEEMNALTTDEIDELISSIS